jgi:DNA adenine methylase
MSKPLFMWAGGKNKMIKNYLPILPEKVTVYSEPFFGGGAMYLYVQERYKPEKAYINDTNEGIIEIYKSIKNNLEEFIDILKKFDQKYIPMDIKSRKAFYYEVRKRHAYDYTNWSKVRESATLYFLMKTGFNGIWQINKNTNNRFGTPSGLLNQKESCFDFDNIRKWNELLQNTEIICGDWKNCPTGDFTFMDPPYRDSFTTYGTGWGDTECDDLVKTAQNIPGLVFLCNRDDGSDFFELRKGSFQIHKFPITYTAGRRKNVDGTFEAKKATEILMVKQ